MGLHPRFASVGQRAGAFGVDLTIIVACLVGKTLIADVITAALGLHAVEMASVIWLHGAFILRNV